jgi:hypothetical protein
VEFVAPRGRRAPALQAAGASTSFFFRSRRIFAARLKFVFAHLQQEGVQAPRWSTERSAAAVMRSFRASGPGSLAGH